MAQELATETGINNVRVYITKKLIVAYGRRINPEKRFNPNPLPQKLLFEESFDKTISDHLMLDVDEYQLLMRLIDYNYFNDPVTGKAQISKFIACLIIHQYEKKFSEEKVKEIKRRKIDPDLDFFSLI